jgi:hypothetical protein
MNARKPKITTRNPANPPDWDLLLTDPMTPIRINSRKMMHSSNTTPKWMGVSAMVSIPEKPSGLYSLTNVIKNLAFSLTVFYIRPKSLLLTRYLTCLFNSTILRFFPLPHDFRKNSPT